MITIIKLTVLFYDPFWIGVFESIENGEYKVCKVTFGSEPKDEEVYELILKKFYRLNFSSPVLSDDFKSPAKPNPKRLQRSIRKEVNVKDIGTKAQIAMQLQHEQSKIVRKQKSKRTKGARRAKKVRVKKKEKA